MLELTIKTVTGIVCSGCGKEISEASTETKNGGLFLVYQCPGCKKRYRQSVTLGNQVITVANIKRTPQQTKVFAKATGTTHQNPDGTSRQDILQKVKSGDELALEETVDHDRTLLLLRHKAGVVGILRQESIDEFRAMYPFAELAIRVMKVTGGDTGNPSYGCNVLLEPKADTNGNLPEPRPTVVFLSADGTTFHADKNCKAASGAKPVNIARSRSELSGAKSCQLCASNLFPELA